jgi:hypothetical protein
MGGFQEFHLQRKVDAGSFTDMSTPGFSDRSATDTNAAADGTYTYRIRTRRAKQYSAWSNETQIVVDTGVGSLLVQSTDFTYLGAAKFPNTTASGFKVGGEALCYNPTNDSLFCGGDYRLHKIAEVALPVFVDSANINDLNTISSVLQPLTAVVPPDMGGINSTWWMLGTMIAGSDLVFCAAQQYDNSPFVTKSHGIISGGVSNLSGTQSGLFKIGTQQAAYFAGGMATIPTEWQASFGAPYLASGVGRRLSITARTSIGPSCFGFDPADFGESAAPESKMCYYPYTSDWSTSLADPYTTNPLWGFASWIGGAVFPAGTDSVLFFGTHGLGTVSYGNGTLIEAEDGTFCQGPSESICWYDPCDNTKGYHAYPYTAYCWAYNANQMLEVHQGTRDPWGISPYAVWAMDMQYPNCLGFISGVGWDETNRRVFLSVQNAWTSGGTVLHAFEIAEL